MRSTKPCELARYFLPNCKSSVIVDEAGNGDINPLWFNVISPAGSFYTSKLALFPRRSVVGGIVVANLDLCENWWVRVNTTVMHVKHNLNVTETNRTQTGTIPGFATMCDGLNNPAWIAGKLPCSCDQERTGIDDIQVKLGWDFYRCDDTRRITAYLAGVIPTGKQQTSKTLFEPLVGSKHGAFGFGFNGEWEAYDCDAALVTLMADLKYLYAFSARQIRSFDLCKHGDWSRYLLVVQAGAPLSSQPGINLLTVPVKVQPRGMIDLWTALHFDRCEMQYEIGYDFWWRQKEKIRNACIAPGFGIQSLSGICSGGGSASTANISDGFAGPNSTGLDAAFTTITNKDLNLYSGSQPSSHSSTIYGSIGWNRYDDCCDIAWIFSVNGSYEFGTKNALNQWGLWATVGGTF